MSNRIPTYVSVLSVVSALILNPLASLADPIPPKDIPPINRDVRDAVAGLDRFFAENPDFVYWDEKGRPIAHESFTAAKRTSFYVVPPAESMTVPTAVEVKVDPSGNGVKIAFAAYDVSGGFGKKKILSRSGAKIAPDADPKDALVHLKGAMDRISSRTVAKVQRAAGDRAIASGGSCAEDKLTHVTLAAMGVILVVALVDIFLVAKHIPGGGGDPSENNAFLFALANIIFGGSLLVAGGLVIMIHKIVRATKGCRTSAN